MAARKLPIAETLDAAVQAAVERGAARIAEVYGEDWFTRIDLDTLDLSSGSYCILGQLHTQQFPNRRGDDGGEAYAVAERRLRWHVPTNWYGQYDDYGRTTRAALHGVNSGSLPYDGTDANGQQRYEYVNYAQLNAAWRAKIEALLAEGGKEV